MRDNILNYYTIIVKLLDNINFLIDEFNVINYNVIFNNNYELLSNLFLNLYKNIIFTINNHIKYIRNTNKKYVKNKSNINKDLDNLLFDINSIDEKINTSLFVIKNKDIDYITNIEYSNIYKKFDISFINDDNNLNILDYSSIGTTHTNNSTYNSNIVYLPDKKLVNIGLDNYYELPVYNTLNDNIPLNIIVYIEDIKTVLIKVGSINNFKYINAVIGKVPNNNLEKNNQRSIICNNNIQKYNKKCPNGTECTYYHDPIIGYPDIAHYERQYSHNPLIYNCVNFKNGEHIKENCKNVSWEDGLNLYQTSFAWVLLGLIHSLN